MGRGYFWVFSVRCVTVRYLLLSLLFPFIYKDFCLLVTEVTNDIVHISCWGAIF
jgi:hypothetical protein